MGSPKLAGLKMGLAINLLGINEFGLMEQSDTDASMKSLPRRDAPQLHEGSSSTEAQGTGSVPLSWKLRTFIWMSRKRGKILMDKDLSLVYNYCICLNYLAVYL